MEVRLRVAPPVLAMSSLSRPEADEYNQYYSQYTGLVPDGDIVKTLRVVGNLLCLNKSSLRVFFIALDGAKIKLSLNAAQSLSGSTTSFKVSKLVISCLGYGFNFLYLSSVGCILGFYCVSN